MVPKVLTFSIAIGALYSYEMKNIDIWAPAFFRHNSSFVLYFTGRPSLSYLSYPYHIQCSCWNQQSFIILQTPACFDYNSSNIIYLAAFSVFSPCSKAGLACSFVQELKIPPPGFFFRVKCTHRCSHAKESHILYALLYNRLSPSVPRTIKRLGSHLSVQYYNRRRLLSFNERHERI